MNKKPFVSVIVPFFNAEKFLSSCIDSILAQTYPDFELILIDDGSNDYSVTIAKHYTKHQKHNTKHQKIRLYHIKNQGVAKARSYGLSQSSGDYILFVDADDWIRKHTLQKLVSEIEDDAIIICSYRIYYRYLFFSNHPRINNRIYTTQTALKELSKNQVIKNYFWGRLYKKELLKQVNFEYDGLFEDIYVMHQIIMKAKKIKLLAYQGYCYRIHSHSLTSNMNYQKVKLMKQAFLLQQQQIAAYAPMLSLSNNPLCMADIMLLFILLKNRPKTICKNSRPLIYSIKTVSLYLFLIHTTLILLYQLQSLLNKQNELIHLYKEKRKKP